MATFRGTDGSLVVDSASVAEIRSWSLTVNRPELETTQMGDSAESFTLDIPNATGAAVVRLDYDDTAQAALVDQAIAGSVPSAMSAVFRVSATKTFTASVLVTSAEITAEKGSLVEMNLGLRVTGAITVSWA